MGKMKKSGINSKASEARDKKAQAKAESKAKAEKQKEDQYWASAGDGQKSKAQKKKDEAEARRAQAAERKNEAKKLAMEEDANMAKQSKKGTKHTPQKVTRAQLDHQRARESEANKALLQKKNMEKARTVTEDQYDAIVLRPNLNREEGIVEARNVEQAIAGLEHVGIAEQEPADAHPERRMRAAYSAFVEAELPRLKEEKPGLLLKQYKDMLWKMWKKSPQNPVVAAKK